MYRTWLYKIRKANNLSQDAVARLCHISQGFYSNLEAGKRDPSVQVAKIIASRLGFRWWKFYK